MAGPSPIIQPPTREEIHEKAARHHIDLSEDEVDYVEAVVDDYVAFYEELDRLPEPRRELEYTDRDPGDRPGEDEDPYNAFVTRCEVRGADGGPLAGYEVGLKDNIAVAGVEMTGGSKVLDGYVPKHDATVVTRLLDAGATVTGKLNLASLAFSGATSEITATGPIRNPRDPDHVAGGSSGGSGAAVVTGDVDIALGGDQGGSIRIPASWCGCVGLKPTWGLVPYTGIQSLEDTLDYVGPLTRTVADCATALEVISGPDPDDPRQRAADAGDLDVDVGEYTDGLGDGVEGMTIGLVSEDFESELTDPAVGRTVRAAVESFEDWGAEVTEVSIPWHPDGYLVWNAILVEGLAAKIRNEGQNRFTKGWYDTQFAEEFGKARRARADDYPAALKATLVLGEYLADAYQGRYYSKAKNLCRVLTAAYDDALDEVDVLALPTTGRVAPEVREAITREEFESGRVRQRRPGATSHSQFNATGHPALSIPCGEIGGLPVGLELVGRKFEEGLLLRAAYAFEGNVDWRER